MRRKDPVIFDVGQLEWSSDINAVPYSGLCKTLVFIHFSVTAYMYFKREDTLAFITDKILIFFWTCTCTL